MSKRLLSSRRMNLRSKLSKWELLEARRLLSGGHGHHDAELALEDVVTPVIVVTIAPDSPTAVPADGAGGGIIPVLVGPDTTGVGPIPDAPESLDATTVDGTQVIDHDGVVPGGGDDQAVPPTDSTGDAGDQNDQGQDDGNLGGSGENDSTTDDQPTRVVVDYEGPGVDSGAGVTVAVSGDPITPTDVSDAGDSGNTDNNGDGETPVVIDDGSDGNVDTGDTTGDGDSGFGGDDGVVVVVDTETGGDVTNVDVTGSGDGGGDIPNTTDLLGDDNGGDTSVATDDSGGSNSGGTSGNSGDSTTEITTIANTEPTAPPPTFSDDPITIVSMPPLHDSLSPVTTTTTTTTSGTSHGTSDVSHTVQQAVTPPTQDMMPVLASTTTSSTPTFVSELAAVAASSDARAIAHHADAASASSASSQQASQTGQPTNGAPAKSSSVAAPAPHTAPSAPQPQSADKSKLADAMDIQVVPGPDGRPILLVRDDDGSLAALLNARRYGDVAGGDENLQDSKPGPNYFRRVTVDAEAVGDSWQVDPTAGTAASVAVFTLPAAVKAAVSIGDQVIVPQATPAVARKPLAAASLTPTTADIKTNSSRSFLAAAAAGVAVVAIQLHQWRKRKLNAAANKLAGLLQFDPLAVWLDERSDRDR